MKIWIDADACPKTIKEHIFKTSGRQKVEVILVANSQMWIPDSPYIRLIQVKEGDDVADFYIVEHLGENDIVITADIPLADHVIKKGAIAINPRGEIYTEENISEKLSVRDFMQELRDSGVETGGPAAFETKDKANFANSLNQLLTKKMK